MNWIRMVKLGGKALGLGLWTLVLACGAGGEKPADQPPAQVDVPAPEKISEDGATSEDSADGTAAADEVPSEGGSAETGLSGQLSGLLSGLSQTDRERTNPLSGSADAIAAGRSEYMSMCFVCHGVEGKGDGPASKATPSTPSDLSSSARAALLSDGDRFAVMRLGIEGTAMPASGANLNDEQIWRILAYVETLVKN